MDRHSVKTSTANWVLQLLGRCILVAALALSVNVASVEYTQRAEAQNLLKKFGRDVKRSGRKLSRGVRRATRDEKIIGAIAVIGGGIVIGKALNGDGISPAAVIGVTAALAATSPTFQREMVKAYRSQWGWSGCVNCNKRGILVPPGRSVSKDRRASITKAMKQDAVDIQTALKTLGHYKIKVDGDYGPGTRKAVKAYQNSIGEPQTDRLTGEQRARLFADASAVGFTRDGYSSRTQVVKFEVPQDVATRSTPAIVETPPKPSIKEFRLAASQFDQFSNSTLTGTGLTELASATLLPDGLIEATFKDVTITPLTFGVEEIEFIKHDFSDRWVVVQVDRDPPVVLNKFDDFASAADADAFIKSNEGTQVLLSKLTERSLPDAPKVEPEIVIAAAPEAKLEPAPKGIVIVQPGDTEETAATETEVAGVEETELETGIRIVAPKSETARAEEPSVPAIQIAGAADSLAQERAAAEASFEDGESCRKSVYVALNYPEGENPILHFNILPSGDSIWFDNGQSSGTVVGECVKGEYAYSYVYLEKNGEEKPKDHIREGTFMLASNGETCDVNLWSPQGSAQVTCY